MSPDASTPAWPAARSSFSAVAAQFGEDRARLMAWALGAGDSLADAVVDEIHGEGGHERRTQLRDGIENGLATLKNPSPAIGALLESAETVPDWADPDLIRLGPRPWFSTPAAVHLIALSAGSLIRVYMSPTIALVLSETGRLVEQADRRVRETGYWLLRAVLPGGLERGAPGYRSTLQVRMLHASMRRMVRMKDFDVASYGVPINQADLARTWMDFTKTSFRAEDAMGYGLMIGEEAELYRYWAYLAHLLGIDPRLVQGLSSSAEAERVDELLEATTGPPLAESAVLAEKTLHGVADEIRNAFHIPAASAVDLMEALARRFHGDRVADALGIPRHGLADQLLSPVISLTREGRERLRKHPDRWNRAIEDGMAEVRRELAKVEDPTTFEKGAKGEVQGT
jgi:hypothetical protein